jgi:hypothetical protein
MDGVQQDITPAMPNPRYGPNANTSGSFTQITQGAAITRSMLAIPNRDTLTALMNFQIPSRILADNSRVVSTDWWRPGLADAWSYSRTDPIGSTGALAGSGGAEGFLGYKLRNGHEEIRIEYNIHHTIDLAEKSGAVDVNSKILYQGDVPPGGNLFFLVPFFRSDDSAHYLVIDFDIASNAAPGTASTAPPAAFGPVIEREITDGYNLDDDQLVDLPAPQPQNELDGSRLKWIDDPKNQGWWPAHGVNLVNDNYELSGVNIQKMVNLQPYDWNEFNMTADKLRLALAGIAPDRNHIHWGINHVGEVGTYGIQTPAGTMVILQVLEATRSGDKIRYRRVQNAVVYPASTPSPSAAQNPTFGPVIERELKMGPDFVALDLDTGRMVDELPDALKLKNSVSDDLAWMESEGMDVFEDTPRKLFGIGMRAIEQDNGGWDRLTASQIVAILDASITKPGFVGELDPLQSQATYVFQTREGGKGILQVLGSAASGLTIRYRLVTP